MKGLLSGIRSRKGQRIVDISLTIILLLVVFSVGGVPMILLSTFPPSWSQGDPERRYNIDQLQASEAV